MVTDRKKVEKMAQPLISVIVPIYNVAPYLRKCLDSLKNQTMDEIEVICIDDGSTDGSGEIAEEYVSDQWPIFRVLHTENRGLSAARNRGINESRADYLMFVDSDDWVESEFCRIPYEAAIRENADLVIFGALTEKGGKVYKDRKRPFGLIDEFTAHEFGGTAVWRRICKDYLFKDIRFPEGRVFEDIAITHKIVHQAIIIFSIPDNLYHRYIRRNSISQTKKARNYTDLFASALERYDDLISYGYPKEKINLGQEAISYLVNTISCSESMYKEAVEIVNQIKGIPMTFTIKQKMALIIWKIDKRLFFCLCKVVRRLRYFQSEI